MVTIPKKAAQPATGGATDWRLPLALALIALVTLAVYWPVLANGFIDFDDDDYVTANTVVQQGLTLKGFLWAFTSFHAANWHPLTWLSHMLDVQLFGLNPMGHHATSLLMHVANALLLCALLNRLTGFLGRSMVVALLFAVHPLHVESVAWVAERKDVLSTLFWLLTTWAYARYAAKPSLSRYLPVAAFFALGLMAKQMLVTLPVVLLLLDYWPLARLFPVSEEGATPSAGIVGLLAEKIPLLCLSGAASLVVVRAQASGNALIGVSAQSVYVYTGNALIAYVKYLVNMCWPAELALFYPFEASAVTLPRVAGAALFLAIISGLVLWQWRKRPYLAFGWLWYLITLLPVIGFIRVGGQALADRYTYIPLVGIFLMVVWGVAEAAGKWRNGLKVAGVVAGVVVAGLSLLTVPQIRYWQNSYDLFAHALAVVERNWLAHNNMGILLSQHGRNDLAIGHFQESVRINPEGIVGYRNLGNSYQMAGRVGEAIDAYRQALWLNPKDAESHFRLGYAYLSVGSADLAYQEYRLLQPLDPANAQALANSINMLGRR